MAVMRREHLAAWIADYEKAWRSFGTAALAELFTPTITYSPSPWREPLLGLDEVARFWEAERAGPEERFEMESEIVALENDTAVVRVHVVYHDSDKRWRDLWVLRFAAGGRCDSFEEWPFAEIP